MVRLFVLTVRFSATMNIRTRGVQAGATVGGSEVRASEFSGIFGEFPGLMHWDVAGGGAVWVSDATATTENNRRAARSPHRGAWRWSGGLLFMTMRRRGLTCPGESVEHRAFRNFKTNPGRGRTKKSRSSSA